MEIERKWLLSDLPKNLEADARYILQTSYISHGKNEVRIRSAFHDDSVGTKETWGEIYCRYKLTIKGPGALSRTEVEFILSREQYDELSALIKPEPILKDYHEYHINGKRIEISRVDNDWVYAEVEFESEKEANDYVLPKEIQEVLVREITYEPEYKMKNYWSRTRTKQE